jgi:hypothetical protein
MNAQAEKGETMMTQAISAKSIAAQLVQDGIAMVPNLLGPEQLRSMQQSFNVRLQRMRWNDLDGYEVTESLRHMVLDVLTLDQGFVDAALDPRVLDAVREYVGPDAELCEAKGWKSLPTKYDFHGWHGDMWYDQSKVTGIPRELKLGIYLTDVQSGAFKYLKGTHGKVQPRNLARGEVDKYDLSKVLEVKGPAGSAFLFDTSGIHRQSIPILVERCAVFYNYHESTVPLQAEDVTYYRYHPLLLNAAFLGGLTEEDQKILGFGNKRNYLPHFCRQTPHKGFHQLMSLAYQAKLRTGELRRRVVGKIKKVLHLG